jgi:RNA-directed DNA polymerase
VLAFPCLRSDLLPRFAARDTNVKRIAGTCWSLSVALICLASHKSDCRRQLPDPHMSQLQSLRASSSLHDVATLLQFKPKYLAYVLYKMPDAAKYHAFKISKRNGGSREINAPCPELKLLQRKLSDLLQNCIEEINAKRKFPDQLAHGFKRDHSIVTNAVKHRRKKYVFNIDLEDFFGTINFGRVRGFFIKNANFCCTQM